jgi:hypothetical protein
MSESKELEKVNQYEQYGLEAVTWADQLPVETAEDMNIASAMRDKIKERQGAIKDFMKPLVDAAHKAHKALTTRRGELLKPFEEAEASLNKKMVDWQTAEDARLAEEQKRADEAAILEHAAKAEEEGNDALAEAIVEGEVAVAAAPVEKSQTKGVSFVETWQFEIEDAFKIPRQFLIPDEKSIKAVVTAQKGRTQIPGVRVFPKKSVKSKPKGMSTRSF